MNTISDCLKHCFYKLQAIARLCYLLNCLEECWRTGFHSPFQRCYSTGFIRNKSRVDTYLTKSIVLESGCGDQVNLGRWHTWSGMWKCRGKNFIDRRIVNKLYLMMCTHYCMPVRHFDCDVPSVKFVKWSAIDMLYLYL